MKKYRLIRAENKFEEYYYIERRFLFWWVKMEFKDATFGFNPTFPITHFNSFNSANSSYMRLTEKTTKEILK